MKRIAIFCDGTWNLPASDMYDLTGRSYFPNNVSKMALALSPESDDRTIQKLYYDKGVEYEVDWIKKRIARATGTKGMSNKEVLDFFSKFTGLFRTVGLPVPDIPGVAASFLPVDVKGGSLIQNLLQAYAFLIINYEPGDELFLFGFSRGAFIVRRLVAMIRISGILQKQYADKIQEAFDIYMSRSVDYHPKNHVPTLFRRSFAVEEVTQIKFIGVWDTVGALGNPLPMKTLLKNRNEFHDTELSSRVENAFHALAIDERRKAFYPTLWHKQKTQTHQVMEQSWFLGGHFDVGGGNLETGLSDISLQWMLEKAQGCNLKFNQLDIKPDPMGKIHFINKRDQNNPRYSRPIKVGWQGSGDTNELIHSSVIERYRNDPTYRPKNLVDYFKRYPIQLET